VIIRVNIQVLEEVLSPQVRINNIDVIHRQIQKLLLKLQRVTHASSWTEQDKRELTFAWHRLSGMLMKMYISTSCPESIQWLNEFKNLRSSSGCPIAMSVC